MVICFTVDKGLLLWGNWFCFQNNFNADGTFSADPRLMKQYAYVNYLFHRQFLPRRRDIPVAVVRFLRKYLQWGQFHISTGERQ